MEDKETKIALDEAMRSIDEPAPQPRPHRRRWVVIALVIFFVLGAALAVWRMRSSSPAAPAEPAVIDNQPQTPEEPEQPKEPEFDKLAIQTVLTQWQQSVGGTAAVVITDSTGTVLAETNPDRSFFAASIYKLYVAYVGYQKIDDGTYKLSDPYLNGWTRGKCLDEMIRTSHSPCGEKMLAELGGQNLTSQLKTYGLKHTSMTAITTSAADAAIVLARIERGQGLSSASQKALMDSMLHQTYQATLQTGFKNADVYSKIGFRDLVEYHDTAIVRLKDGRSLIVSVLTENVGTRNIARLGASLEAALAE